MSFELKLKKSLKYQNLLSSDHGSLPNLFPFAQNFLRNPFEPVLARGIQRFLSSNLDSLVLAQYDGAFLESQSPLTIKERLFDASFFMDLLFNDFSWFDNFMPSVFYDLPFYRWAERWLAQVASAPDEMHTTKSINLIEHVILALCERAIPLADLAR